MRRLFAAVLCLLGLALAVSVSLADQVGAHKATIPLSFRTTDLFATLAARDGNAKHLSGTIGYLDSVSYQRNGRGVIVGTTAGTADTTAGITTPWFRGPGFAAGAGDTSAAMRVSFWNAGNTGTVDSLYLIIQVSANGTVWETANQVKDAAAANPYTAASVVVATTPVILAANLTGSVLLHECIAGRTSVDLCGLYSWPYIRFIVLDDITSATAINNFSGNVVYESANALDGK